MAGTIDSLKFDVILNDKDFSKAVERDLKLARELNTKLTSILNLKKRLNGETTQQIVNAEKVRQAAEKTKQEYAKTALAYEKVRTQVEKTAAAARSHHGAVRSMNASLTNTAGIMRTLAQLTGITFSLVGVRRFLSSLIEITGQFEVQKMALRNMLQDVAAADRIFRQLYDFSSESTYRFSELAKYAKQLSAFNIGKDNLLETTKMLGDVASGVGVSMDRLILAYGHVKSSGFLRGIQLRSFSQNGVPILEELAKMFSEMENRAVSLGEVFDKMMKREIPFEMVEEGFRRMTSEGGKFYKMQEVLSKTLAGQINILKGKWENALYAIGEANDGILKDGVRALKFVVEHLQEIGAALKPVIVGFGAYGVALATASMANWVTGAARAAKYFVIIAQRTNIATAAMRLFGTTTKAVAVSVGALSAAIVIILSLIQATGKARREMSDFRKELDEIHESARKNAELDAEISKIDSLRKVLNDANNTLDARKAALLELRNIVPGYHAELTEEGRLINNNTTALDKYIAALNREAKMKGAQDELTELYRKRREVQKEVSDAEKNEEATVGGSYYTGAVSVSGYAFVPLAASASKANRELSIAKQKLTEIDNQISSVNQEIAETIGLNAESAENYDVKTIVASIKNYDNDIKRLRDKAKKGSITAIEKENLDTWQKERQEQAELYKSILGIDYDKDNKTGGRGGSSDPFAERISELKKDISVLEKYKNAYDKLEPVFGEDAARAWVFNNMGYDIANFDADIEKLIADLKKLGDSGKDAAESIEASLGVSAADKALKAQKALDDYNKMMDKWENRDFNLWGETEVERKAAKVVSDYVTKENEIEDERTEAIKKATKAHKGNAAAIEQETKRINELAEKNKEYERTLAQDKITNLADDYYKQFTEGIDMESLSSKSRAELDNIRTKINEAKAAALAAIDAIADKLKEKGFNVEELKVEVADNFDKAIEKTDQAQEVKNYNQWQRAAQKAAQAAKELADGLERLGEAAGDGKLANIAQGIRGNAEAMEGAVNGVKEYGGWWGAIIGALKVVGKELIEDAAIWEEVKASVEKSQATALVDKMDNLLGSNKGSLGSSWTHGLHDAVSVMDQMRKKALDVEAALTDQEITKTFNSSLLNPIPIETWLDNILYKFLGFNANIFSRVNGDYKAYQDAIAKGYEGAEAYILKTHDRSGFLNALGFDDKYSNLKDVIEGLGYELYDEYGNLNAKGLQAILDTYTKLGAEDRKWIEEAIMYSEEYEKAVEQVKETIEDLFGNMTSTLADNMIQAFQETGNAVADLEKAFDSLGETFVKSMLESAIYETVLKEYEKQMQDIFLEYGKGGMDYSDMLDRVNGVFDGMTADFEKSADVYNAILDRASDLNWIGESSDSQSLGSGIKSITEETANLLASYLNAIRADVSYMRSMQESGWKSIEQMGAYIPTLDNYLNQIAASDYDTAQNTNRILAELQSVIGSPGTTGSVVRVEAYR